MKSLKTRLDEKFRVTPGCWLWLATKTDDGYGMIRVDRRMHLAHRISYSIYVGPVPDDEVVCHSCDVPGCVNPDHLFLGTQSINCIDRNQKGRHYVTKGSSNGRAKLTETDIPKIVDDPRPKRVIAQEYGISRSLVSRIKLRQCWRHVC